MRVAWDGSQAPAQANPAWIESWLPVTLGHNTRQELTRGERSSPVRTAAGNSASPPPRQNGNASPGCSTPAKPLRSLSQADPKAQELSRIRANGTKIYMKFTASELRCGLEVPTLGSFTCLTQGYIG